MTVPSRRKGPGFQPTKGPGIGLVPKSAAPKGTNPPTRRYRGKRK